jgi:hypothetical protein
MPPSLFEKLTDWLKASAGNALSYAALSYAVLAAVAVVVLWIAWRLLRRRKRVAAPLAPDLKILLAELGNDGPPPGPPILELYNLPVRLAAIVFAPVGRVSDLPPDEQLPTLIEAIIPGLDKMAAQHRPLMRRWPSQVSARGFAHLFFANAKLPGDGGKGSPWASVAGMVKVQGQPIMAGLVLRASAPNSLGQTIIEEEHQWLGCLRVRWT